MGIRLYDREWPNQVTVLDIELYLFRESKDSVEKYQHGRKAAEMLWPDFVWNEWSEETFKSCCETHFLGLTGASASSKSHTLALWFLLSWLCSPHNTIVLIFSTTLQAAKRRIWASVVKLYYSHAGRPNFQMPGKLIGGQSPAIKYIDAEGKVYETAGLIVLPSERGDAAASCSLVQGIHQERVMVGVDEAPGAAPSIDETIYSNLRNNPYFWCSYIGNPDSRLDPHGRFCTPIKGWDSISVKDKKWKSRWREEEGVTLHFDARDNPNYIARENIYPFLQPWETIEKEINGSGSDSAYFWKMFIGFWPPSSTQNTVFSEADLIKFKTSEPVVWKRPPVDIAGLDPAFTEGGDKSIASWIQVGENNEGKTVILIKETEIMREDVTNTAEPLSYQRTQKFKEFCEKRKILPRNSGYDSTGGGVPYGEIVGKVYSTSCLAVCFGGSASDRLVGQDSPRKACEQYTNSATELIFNAVEFLRNGQLFGISDDVAVEWTTRRFIHKTDANARLQVEPKKDFKARNGYSPDASDSILISIEVARQRLNLTPGGGGSIPNSEGQSGWVKAFSRFKNPKSATLKTQGSGGWSRPLNRAI